MISESCKSSVFQHKLITEPRFYIRTLALIYLFIVLFLCSCVYLLTYALIFLVPILLAVNCEQMRLGQMGLKKDKYSTYAAA
jgi:hypothetical protein